MIYTFIVVEYHISIYDINGKSDLICHDKNSITIYTHHLVRQTVLTTCLGMLDRVANTLANSSNRFLTISGVARGRAIGQLPNDSKVFAQEFFEMLPIAQCRKILILMYVRRSKWCYRNTMSLVMIWSSDSERWTNNLFH